MRKYNLTRPLIILGVAFGTNIIVANALILFGVHPETASNIGFAAMIIAAFYTFARLNRSRRR